MAWTPYRVPSAAASISLVLVLPFVPVMAITGPVIRLRRARARRPSARRVSGTSMEQAGPERRAPADDRARGARGRGGREIVVAVEALARERHEERARRNRPLSVETW